MSQMQTRSQTAMADTNEMPTRKKRKVSGVTAGATQSDQEQGSSSSGDGDMFKNISITVLENVVRRIFEHAKGNSAGNRLAMMGVQCYFEIIQDNAKKEEEGRVRLMRHQIEAHSELVKTLREEKDEQAKTIGNLNEKTRMQAKITTNLHKKIEGQANKISQKAKIVDALEKDDQALRNHNDFLKGENDDFEEVNKIISQENKALVAEKNVLKVEKNILEDEIKMLKQTNANLEEGVKKLNKSNLTLKSSYDTVCEDENEAIFELCAAETAKQDAYKARDEAIKEKQALASTVQARLNEFAMTFASTREG